MQATAPLTHARRSGLGREAWGWLVTAAVIALGIGFLFARSASFIGYEWTQPEYSHGWLIPAVTAFVLWSRRAVIAADWRAGSWLGVGVALLALVLLILSDMAFVQRGPFIAFVLLLGGLGLAAVGWRAMRWALVPLVFLFFAFPLPGSMAVPLSTYLQLISSQLGTAILQLLGISVFLDGNIIDLGVYKLQVAEACSGLRYLFPLGAFGFLCAWMYRAPWWAKAVVLLSVIPITIGTNSARIALTGVFIEYGSVELAEGFMHLFEGWVIFIIALFLLFLEMWLLAWLIGGRTRPADLLDFDRLAGSAAAPARAATPGRQVPAPLVACAGLILATALAHGPLTQRDQIIPVRPGLLTFPMRVGDWTGRSTAITDPVLLEGLGANDYLLADFASTGASRRVADAGGGAGAGAAPTFLGGAPVNLWVAYYDHQLGDAAIHSPKDCLPGGGWEYVTLDTVQAPVTTADGRQFLVNRGVIAKGTEQMVIYYWLEIRGRHLTNELALKLYNLWDSYNLGRSDGALVRVMTPVAPEEKADAAEARLRDFVRAAYPSLEPHVGA